LKKNINLNTSNDKLSTEEWNTDSGIFREYEFVNDSILSKGDLFGVKENYYYGKNTAFVDEEQHLEKVQEKKKTWFMLKQSAFPKKSPYDFSFSTNSYFCDYPSKEYAHFVVKRIGPNSTDSLFDLNGLLALCEIQEKITSIPDYEEFCQTEMYTNTCCKPWSLSNYAALLANKTKCFDLIVSIKYKP